ncbi:MAG: hypothetical protein Harvfovirus46_12 [Harvfovirus sp.]|uniref:Uncharacterized protein n=1 Tax=Harvfovirus sp. TaxID=2487768 RepID=A0A3G5A8D4_9VIRU|nr:MAG: hypothetical protein Harvfovirus46_12 [Harvfovirus sp.]
MSDNKDVQPHLKPGQIVEAQRTRVCCHVSKVIYIFTIMVFLSNLAVFFADLAITRISLAEFFSGKRECGLATIALLCNTYIITSDIFIHKMMLNGAKLKDYKDGIYHITVLIQLIMRVIFYAVIYTKINVCNNSDVTGTIYQVVINAVQFLLTVASVYIPLFLVFLNMEPTKCLACCIYTSDHPQNHPVV